MQPKFAPPAHRFVFIGASKFGLRCLEALTQLPAAEVVGAVTAPQFFPISYNPKGVVNVLHADVEGFCRVRDIPVATLVGKMNCPDLFGTVRGWRPDAFLVAGWYHMVPRMWRDLAPAYGPHASLLPDYSGGAPLVWAIIEGAKRTGISLFKLGDGVDDGPLLGQLATPIDTEDTIATLYSRIEELGLALVREHIDALTRGEAVLTSQDESKRRIVPQRSPEDGRIDWQQSVEKICDFVRAQTRPYPGAFTETETGKLTIWAARPNTSPSPMPGRIGGTSEHPIVGCGDGHALELLDVGFEGQDIAVEAWWDRHMRSEISLAHAGSGT